MNLFIQIYLDLKWYIWHDFFFELNPIFPITFICLIQKYFFCSLWCLMLLKYNYNTINVFHSFRWILQTSSQHYIQKHLSASVYWLQIKISSIQFIHRLCVQSINLWTKTLISNENSFQREHILMVSHNISWFLCGQWTNARQSQNAHTKLSIKLRFHISFHFILFSLCAQTFLAECGYYPQWLGD